MNLIDRYIGQAVIAGVFSVLVVLTALYILFAFAGESSKIGQASYTLWHAIEYSLYLIPRRLYELFPLSMLLGTMLGLGWLANHNELVVIRMAGLSLIRIVIGVMKTAIILMILAIVIGEGIAPPLYQYASQQRVKALNQKISLNTDYGLWAKDGATYIHVKRVKNNGQLNGVTLYEMDQAGQLNRRISAKGAVFDGDKWLLKKVVEYRFNALNVEKITHKQMPWKTLLDQDMVNIVSIEPDRLPIWELQDYIRYLKNNELDSARHELAMWAKLFSPLTILAMVLLAVPFVFGSVRNITIGKQILLGFLVGIVFYIGSRLVGQMGLVYGIPPVLSALIPTLIVIGITLYSYRKIR